MTQEKKSIFYEMHNEIGAFFDQERIKIYGDVPKTSLSEKQRDEYIFCGYVAYFNSIPAEQILKRICVFQDVLRYARILTARHNTTYNVFEMCNLVTKE